MAKLNRTELKVVNKLALSMFAEHLYEGLTVKKNYGLVEATRHWHAAVNDPTEYAFIEYPSGTSSNCIVLYLTNYEENVKQLEDLLRDLGTLNLNYEELDALAIQRKEN